MLAANHGTTGIPMKELGKELKKVKGFASPQVEQHYQPTRPPRASTMQTTNQRVHMEGPMAPATYVAEDYLIWHQWEGRPLVLWRLDVPMWWDAKVARWDWMCRWRSTLIEQSGWGMR